MKFNSNDKPLALDKLLINLKADLLAPIHKIQQYDYVWGRQSMHQNLIADYKKRKNNINLQSVLVAFGLLIILILMLLFIFGDLYYFLYINDFLGLFIVGFMVFSFFMVASSLSIYLFYKNNHFEKRYYYLNSKYLIILKEDIKQISVDTITQLDTLSAIKVENNCIELYIDTLNPIVIHCDNEAEIADFINQQISQNAKNNE